MQAFCPSTHRARPISRALRRYRSGIRPLEDRVTMSASPWSGLDHDEASALLAGTSYVQNELIVALKNTAANFADVLAIESARDAVTASAVTDQQLLAAATNDAPALYQLTLAAGADFVDTLAAISNWTSVEWVTPDFVAAADTQAAESDDGGDGSSTQILSGPGILEAPGITPIGDVTILEDGTALVDVFITDLDSPASAISVSASDGGVLLPPAGITATYLSGNQWRLSLAPVADRFGSSVVTVTANDGSAVGSTTFQFNVTAVNDAPSFATVIPVYVTPADGPFASYQWVKNISSGPNETGQNLSFLVQIDAPSLFSVLPTIDAAGTLRFTGAGLTGTVHVTVRLQDDGGTASGGVDTSAPQTFDIHFTNTTVPSGILDPTFDADGVRTLASGVGAQDFARDIARQADGKFVVVGYSQSGTFTSPSAVTRYNADGSLDTSFGVGGIVTLANTYNTQFFRLTAVEITSDGNILVAGDGVTGYYVARLNADGSLDASFGTGGSAIFTLAGSFTVLSAAPVGLALQADGQAVLTRLWRDATTGSSNSRISVLRITASGAVDATFGGSGTGFYLAPWSGSASDVPNDLVVQSDGKIVVVGSIGSSGGGDFFALRLTALGVADSTFGSGGMAIVNVGSSPTGADAAFRVALQSDGKIVLAGTSSSDFGLVRLNADGSLDTSFDSDGKVVTSIGSTDQGFALAIQSDGNIVVGGSVSGNGNDFGLARYTTAGALDTTFDGDGKKIQAFGTGNDQIYGLLVESDGKIVVAGVATTTLGGNDFTVARFAADGTLDTSFGGGIVTTNVNSGSVNLSRSIVLDDGRILVAGMLGENASVSSGRYGVWRLLPDGSLDVTFGTGGAVVGDLTGWAGAGFVRQTDGKLLLLDSSGNRIVRLTADGAVDAAFGTAGVVSFSSSLFTFESGLAVQADGKILVIGFKTNASTTFDEFAVARFTAAGVLDTTFDGDGQVLIDVAANNDRAAAITQQTDGKLVVVGTTNGGNDDFAIVRLNTSGSLDTSFSGDGKIVEALSASIDTARSVLVQADGKIVVAGSSAGDFAVVRYTAGGLLDTTFAGDGTFTKNFSGTDDAYTVLQQDDGKLLVAGHSNAVTTGTFLSAFRLSVDGTIDTSFDGGDGVVFYQIGSTGTAIVASAALEPDGKLLAVGVKNQEGRYDALLLRYLTRPTAVNTTPALAAIADQSVGEDGTLSFTVTVSDQDTPADWLQLSVSSTSVPSLFTSADVTLAKLGGGQWSVAVKPRPDQFGSGVVTLAVTDGLSTATRSFNVDVSPVNDAPSFVKGADVFAGAGVPRAIDGWAQNVSAGKTNESGQHLTFLTSVADPSLFDVLPAIDATGRFTFTAKSSAAGQVITVSVRLQDDGGTAGGGVDTSAPQSFTITVVNAPLISTVADQPILEDGQAIVDFSVTDADTPAASTVVSAQSGDAALLPPSGVALSDLGSGNYRLTLTPAADRFGPVVVTLTASDGITFSTRTFTLDVAAVNDVPSFVKSVDQYVALNAGAQAVYYWAKSISNGAFESAQQRTFLVTVDDPSLFAALPTISADGTLAYTPAVGKLGTATVTVRLQDDGGTASGGIDTSAPQTFQIHITDVTLPSGGLDPSFDADGIRLLTSSIGAADTIRDMARQADGKLVVVGNSAAGSGRPVGFAYRFNADGTLDTSFGNGGRVTFADAVNSTFRVYSVKIAADGKIVVAGDTGGGYYLARLNSNGAFDPTLGTGGFVAIDIPNSISGTLATVGLALQSDGKAVVTRYLRDSVTTSANNRITVARVNLNGTLDGSFASAGVYTAPWSGSGSDTPQDVAIQADGKIVVVGSISSSGGGDFFALRLTASGAADSTFGSGGMTIVNVGSSPSGADTAFRVALQTDGKIVLAGTSGVDFGLVRLNTDGSLDTSFDSDGKVVTSIGPTDQAFALAIQSDGKIVVAGSVNTGGTDFALARFTTTGALDTTFDGDGKKTYAVGTGSDQIRALLIQPDGKIVVAGVATLTPGGNDLAIGRFLADGSLDASFGGGVVTADFGPGATMLSYTIALPDGRVLVAGVLGEGGGVFAGRFAVWRFLADGSLDPTFGSGGVVVGTQTNFTLAGFARAGDGKLLLVDMSGNRLVRLTADGALDPTFGSAGVASFGSSLFSFETGLAVQSDGAVVVIGWKVNASTTFDELAVARFTVAGVLDTTFDGDGQALVNLAADDDRAAAIAVQSDGKIVVVGTANNGSRDDIAVVRLNTDGSLDTTFSGDGKIIEAPTSSASNARGVLIQGGGKIVVVGDAGGGFCVVRYNTDGSLDTAFSGDGIVTGKVGTTDDGYSVVEQADGKFVVTGFSDVALMVVRLTADGAIDTTFDGGDGAVGYPVVETGGNRAAAAVGPDGKLIVVTSISRGGRFDGAVFRFLLQPSAVGAPPSISTIADQSVAEGGTVTFTVTLADPDTPPDWLQLGLVTSDSDLLAPENVTFTSLGGGLWSMALAPRADQFGSATMALTVFDGMTEVRRSFQLTVTPVNDAPSFVKGADVFAGIGAAYSAAGWAQSASPGNLAELGQNLTFLVTAADPSLFNVLPSIDAAGNLTFTTKSSAAGQSTVVTVRLRDDGGTAAGGADTSAPQTFTINIGNAPAVSIADHATVEGGTNFVDFFVSDLDSPAGSIVLTATSADAGLLPAVGLVLQNFGAGNWLLTLTPAADRFGATSVTITASDGVYSSARTITFTVAGVNDRPSFDKGPDQYVDAGAGPQTVAGWAKAISVGPFETSQQPTFLVSVDDPTLFSVLPTIAADGTLAYTLAPGTSGIATVTVRLQDDGGTTGGGVDISDPQTFTIRALTVASTAGDFDPTFAAGGIASLQSPLGSSEAARDLAVQANGKIVVVGGDLPGIDGAVLVRRFNADGSLDAGFAAGGIARFDFGPAAESGTGVAIGADGNIYVAMNDGVDFNVLRLLADGSLDASFGVGGKATAGSTQADFTTGLAVEADGRIVVVGGTSGDIAAARFNADGTLDASFGAGGLFRLDVGNGTTEQLSDVVLMSDGRIAAVGTAVRTSSVASLLPDIAVIRLTDRGVLDLSFAAGGLLLASPVASNVTDQGIEIAVDGFDRIVVGGLANNDFVLLRLNVDGSRDASFGEEGWVRTNFHSTDTAQGLLLLPDGDILVVGTTSGVGATDAALARYRADGSLDTSFGEAGRGSIAFGTGFDGFFAAAVQADGRVLLAGTSIINGDGRLALARIGSNGSFDPSFDGDGVVTPAVDRSSWLFDSMVRQPDGKLVVGGTAYPASGTATSPRMAVFRFLADGTLDTSFGTGGVALHPNGLAGNAAQVVLQADGKIVAVGRGGTTGAGVMRLNADGSLDTTFAGDGTAGFPSSGTFTSYQVTIQPDGKIIVVGSQSSNFAALRFKTDGTLDTTFSGDGVMNFDAGGVDAAQAVVLEADGRIVLAGYGWNGSNDDFVVARLNADGTLDTSFDGDGWARTAVGSGTDRAAEIVLQADGKIVIGGTTAAAAATGTDWALVRYNAAGSLDSTFDGDGIVTWVPGGGDDVFNGLAIQADGRLVAVGSAANGTAIDTVVARFLPSGRLDPTFAEDGLLLAPLSSGIDSAAGLSIDPDGKIVVAGYAEVNGRYEGRIIRLLNEADEAPTVAGVYVRGSAWTASYLDYLDANGLGGAELAGLGYALTGGSSQLTTTLPWSNVDRITVRFDRDVVASLGSLTLYDSSGQGVAALGFRYLDGRTVEWIVPVLGANKYLINIDAAMVAGIADLALDGEWATSTTTWTEGSGDGEAGGDFNFRFNVLPGDFDSSGSVAFGEIGQARLKLGQNTSSAGYLYRQDYDGSGSITFGEIGQARSRLGTGISGFDDPPTPPDSLEFQDASEQNIVAEPIVLFDDVFQSVASTPEFFAWEAPAATEDLAAEASDFVVASFVGGSEYVASPLFFEPAEVVDRLFTPYVASPAEFVGQAAPQATFDLSPAALPRENRPSSDAQRGWSRLRRRSDADDDGATAVTLLSTNDSAGE